MLDKSGKVPFGHELKHDVPVEDKYGFDDTELHYEQVVPVVQTKQPVKQLIQVDPDI